MPTDNKQINISEFYEIKDWLIFYLSHFYISTVRAFQNSQ